jgi:DNA-binding CsgD family transcriptional regulator
MYEKEKIELEYFELLNTQKFVENDLDYSVLELQKPFLQKLSMVGNSVISVFDLFKKQHVFSSNNLQNLFSYDSEQVEHLVNESLDSKIHPDDFLLLMRNGIRLMRFILSKSHEERSDFKLINEYRILNNEGKYVRVIEQHQPLEFDKYGNIWLTLSVLDISPNQENYQGIKCQILNYRTGKLYPLLEIETTMSNSGYRKLTRKELEILHLVKDGFLSKEISDKLSISVHTVNTHRQRILEKLGVDNSMEAVNFASSLGLLD